jgi:acyl-CoA reductase-like NAD-dependent aldehyde dehydrogenase
MTARSVATHPMTIDGAVVAGSNAYVVLDPSSEEEVGAAPSCTPDELDRAVRAAARAFPAWARDEGRRRAALRAMADALAARVDEVATLLTAEQGKPLKAAAAEVSIVVDSLRWYAELDTASEVLRDDEGARVELRRRPIGVVAAIVPWNFPLALAGYKLAPALLAGNTVVIKPAPTTPLSTLLVGTVFAEHLPPGVLNVISGPDPLGARLVEHPGVQKVSFTGSVQSGRSVARQAAGDLKRLTLELGGNDPAVLLDDVDVEGAVRRIFWSAFENNGQTCLAVKRVYAPRALYDDVVAAFADRARRVRVGDGRDPDAQLGPLHSRQQLDRTHGLLRAAIDAGASVAAGGDRIGDCGFFHAPTIVTGARDGMALVDEEQFGPVLPIIAYDDEVAAVAAANATHFGLGASVWSADPERAEALGEDIDAGTLWINAHLQLTDVQPFGGVKSSGVGMENGRAGWEAFTDMRVHHRARR